MILPVRRVRRCLVAAVLSLSALAGAASRSSHAQEISSDHIRVAIACQADAETASVVRDQIAAALSAETRVEVVERAQIDLLLQEGSFNAVLGDETRRTRLGRLLSLDYFLDVRRAGGAEAKQWLIEAVNAQTGALVGSLAEDTATGQGVADAAARFVRERLVGKPVIKPDGVGFLRVAVPDFTPAHGDDLNQEATGLRLSAQVRTYLGSRADVLVLDRALAQQVAQEHNYIAAGLVSDASPRLPLLGADVVIVGQLTQAAGQPVELALTALNVHGARPIATQAFPLAQERGMPLPDVACAWLNRTLRVSAGGAKRTWKETIQVEALEPFYRGIAKFQAGHILEATDDFQRAYTLNEKFRDAMLWEARCYDALGLAPLADGERRFVANELVGRGCASTGTNTPDAAVTFLGLTSGADPGQRTANDKLEMLAIDVLTGLGDKPRLQLASHLAAFRDEYDTLVGTPDALGTRWSDAPTFLTQTSLYGETTPPDAQGRRTISWRLVDTVGGQVRARAETVLGTQADEWSDALRPALAALWKQDGASLPASPVFSAADLSQLPAEDVLASQVTSREGTAANAPILALLLRNPRSPLLLTHHLSKGGSGYNLETFLNFAVRDYLLSRLPTTDPIRAWLELERIDKFLPCDGSGPALGGDYTLDAHAELERFASAHSGDAPGCLAAYQMLYDQLGSLEPSELAERLGQLKERLARYSEADFFQYHLLPDMIEALRVTALVATGKYSNLSLITASWPHILYVRFGDPRFTSQDGGKPGIDQGWGWRTQEWGDTPESIQDATQEARAALAVLGRGDALERIPEFWLRDFPTSGVLTAFAIDSLHEGNYGRGRPMLYEFNAVAERAHYRDVVGFCYRNLCARIDRARTLHELDYWEHWVDEFVRNLCDWAYLDTVPDSEFDTMRAGLGARVNSAGERCGGTDIYQLGQARVDWRQIVRRPAVPVSTFESLWGPPRIFYDREALLNNAQRAGARTWTGSPVTHTAWTEAVHDHRLEMTVTSSEIADLYLPYLPLLGGRLPGPALDVKETAFVFDFAYTLMDGGKLPEAEEVFRRLLNAPLNHSGGSNSTRELHANASLAMCLISRAAGRKAEALNFAQNALALAGDAPFRVLGRIDHNSSPFARSDYRDGQALALRLSAQLRGDAATAALPPQVRATIVPTPNLANAEVTYFYRVPLNYHPGQSDAAPVLVIVPSINQDALDFCLDTNPWARWADAQGIFLVVPEFLDVYCRGTGPATVAEFHCAQVWSGKATLQAVENVRAAGYHVSTERLLLHGFGGGSQFVDRFARWAPERCAALSLHSTDRWTWFDWTPGLKSLESLRGVPCLVTTGAHDVARRDAAAQWVTMARGAGLPVAWKELPGVGHYPTREMEELSRAFLAQNAGRTRSPSRIGQSPKTNPLPAQTLASE